MFSIKKKIEEDHRSSLCDHIYNSTNTMDQKR
jgi:hypothetical protein